MDERIDKILGQAIENLKTFFCVSNLMYYLYSFSHHYLKIIFLLIFRKKPNDFYLSKNYSCSASAYKEKEGV